MNRIRTLRTAATAALLALPHAATAQVPTAPVQPFEYAVKFVCGTATTPPAGLPDVMPGSYLTLVNVHNPGPSHEFTHKVSLAALGGPGRMTPFQPYLVLRYDESTDFNCRLIRARLVAAGIPVGPFFTGFLVIQSPRQLDVVAVYSAGAANGQVASVHTERVQVRRVM
ncbi:MAG TPA: hypothetical protein VF782_13550 [Allosphingosinicella sp.]|jgi:hypothetical protein